MNNLLIKTKVFWNRNSSTIMAVVGGVGVVATSIMAVKATPKALELIEKAKEEKGEKLTKLEVVKVAGPVYIPSALMGVSTLACIFGANALNKRRQAGLISAYAMLDSSYKEYKNKVKALYGEEAVDRVQEEIAKDKYEEEEIELEDNKQLFFDDFSGRYFESTLSDVRNAEYLLNRRLAMSGYCCLNEFYELLGMDDVDGGEEVGWSAYVLNENYSYAWLDFYHKKVVLDDGLECYIVEMLIEPDIDYIYY